MTSFTNNDYLDLLQKLVDEQYDDVIDDYDAQNMAWIPAEPEIKEKIKDVNHKGIIDLTHVKSDKIKEEIHKCGNVRVGSFKIIIRRYNGVPSQQGAQLCCDLKIVGHRSKTMNGMPCNMDYDVDVTTDSRFTGQPWLSYFKVRGYANNVPIDTVVNIVRWLQGIHKLAAFL